MSAKPDSKQTDIPQQPRAGGVWEHYKGDHYELMVISRREADGSLLATYTSLSRDELPWTRPLDEFLAKFTEMS